MEEGKELKDTENRFESSLNLDAGSVNGNGITYIIKLKHPTVNAQSSFNTKILGL